ncbi:MAG: thioredoxin family protein [Rhodospirillales bacterium]|nr:thioredoxin family protein [Rhodospirillales bacterium]MCB9996169.1 thioredoxin family protein [Rhodospirillales bacterium]
MQFIRLLLVIITLAGAAFSPISAQAEEKPSHVTLTLLPEMTQIEPGQPFFVAIKQDIADGWHTYWVNAGDSGEPMRVNWHLPEGFKTGALTWPVPQTINFGPLTNYGYEGQAVILQEMTTPTTLPEGPVEIKADIDILVCEETCIPEYHQLSFTLNDGSNTDNSEIVTEAINKTPVILDWPAKYSENGQGNFVIDMAFKQPGLVTKGDEKVLFDIIPYEWGLIDNTQKTGVWIDKSGKFPPQMILQKKRGERPLNDLGLQKILVRFIVNQERTSAMELTVEPDPQWLETMAAKTETAQDTAPAEPKKNQPLQKADGKTLPQISLIQALLFALLGGLILNLMPCVFPILSMKALSLCKMNAKDERTARLYGLAYTAGILLCFAAIAAILIGLKSAGAQIGWGFQLQNPLVVLGLAYLLFALGLNLSGFFEITGSFTNIGGSLSNKHGISGSFFTGVLATLVATPCTAPFMGAAMGFALTQPEPLALLVFLSLGFGLALPYLLLSFIPALRSALPKPGPWMAVFRELLAFPMYGSAVWLVWVFSQQTGTMALLYALAGFVGISFAVWMFRYNPKEITGKIALRGLAVMILLTVLIFSISAAKTDMHVQLETTKVAATTESSLAPYTAERYTALIDGDAPVFINMTAAWCITCKVNERVALNIESTKALFTKHGVQVLKGDWTNQDPEITAYLDRYGRNGVPLYVYYGPRNPKTGDRPEPKVLPQLLAPGIIAKLFEKDPV